MLDVIGPPMHPSSGVLVVEIHTHWIADDVQLAVDREGFAKPRDQIDRAWWEDGRVGVDANVQHRMLQTRRQGVRCGSGS